MLDIGWSEMAVIALIALVVIGPKDLPQAMRAAAKWVRKARGLAREFQSGIDDMIREADLDDARKAMDQARSFNVEKAFEDTVDPTGTVKGEVRDLEVSAQEKPGSTKTRAASEEETTKDDAEPKQESKATVVEQPLKVAPADSIRPPDEAGSADPAAPPDAAERHEANRKTGESKT